LEVINISICEEKTVGRLTEIIALQCGVCSDQARTIRTAATLHDIGKQKIPEVVLNKPGALDEHEFEIIKAHTTLGTEILMSVQGELGVMARTCCLYHHEWFNGEGYWGRRIGDLPFYVALVAISDVFTALISERPYKSAWPPGEAVQYIQSKAGTQFDPELVEVFLSVIRDDSRVPALFMEGR
jgi:putative two-component system response regulator